MGFLSKFFGNKGGTNNSAPDALMGDEQFWALISTSWEESEGEYERQQEALENNLSTLTEQEIILFDNKFRDLRGKAYTWDLWAAIYIIHGGCGDDSFHDFREWVIAQGRLFYNRTVAEPASLIDFDPELFEADWEGMGYVAGNAFKKVTGQEMISGFKENEDITGEEWGEEGDDLKLKYPLLWDKYAA